VYGNLISKLLLVCCPLCNYLLVTDPDRFYDPWRCRALRLP